MASGGGVRREGAAGRREDEVERGRAWLRCAKFAGDGAAPHLRCLLPMMILYIPKANTPVPPIASAMDESPDLGRLRPYFGMR